MTAKSSASFQSTILKGGGKMGLPLVDVPTKTGEEFQIKSNTRLVATFDGGVERHCALRKSKDGLFYITLSKAFLKEIKKSIGEEVHIHIRHDDSKYGMPIPEEWQEFMDQDEEIAAKFEALTPGGIRGYLHYLGQPKSVDARIRRCLDFSEKLKTNTLFVNSV